MLSQHFLTAEQKAELLASVSSARIEHLRSLLASEEYKHNSEQWRQLETHICSLGEGEVASESQDELMRGSLKSVKGQNLERLCGMWGMAGGVLPCLLPSVRHSVLRSRLESHLNYVYTTDWLVEVEGGVANLRKDELEKLCLERCLVSKEQSEMEEFLQKWIQLSTKFQV
jgi:primosomal replication protein N